MSTLLLRSGDARPWINEMITSWYPSDVVLHSTPEFVYKCEVVDGKWTRHVAFPDLSSFVATISATPDRIHLAGVRIVSKLACFKVQKLGTKPDRHEHWCSIFINPVTKTVVVYNPLMFHTQSPNDFSIALVTANFAKALTKAMETAGLASYKFKQFTAKRTLINKVQSWRSGMSSRIWYPLICLWEMCTVIENPALSQKGVQMKMVQTENIAPVITSIQERLEAYYMKQVWNIKNGQHVCENRILNPETGRCVLPHSGLGHSLQGLTQSKICDDDQGWNVATKRCKKFQFVKVPNVYADTAEKTFVDNAATSFVLLDYLQKKYAHAGIFYRRHGSNVILWKFDVATKKSALRIPQACIDFWRNCLA